MYLLKLGAEKEQSMLNGLEKWGSKVLCSESVKEEESLCDALNKMNWDDLLRNE